MEQEVSKLTHITKFQQLILLGCIKRYEDILGSNLGEWTGPSAYIPLKDKAKPYHARFFLIQVIHIESLKKYLDRQVAIGVLKKINRIEWADYGFIISKNYG